MRTGSREFLEWVDLDERDFKAIARFCRRAWRLTLLIVLPLVILAVLIILRLDVLVSVFGL